MRLKKFLKIILAAFIVLNGVSSMSYLISNRRETHDNFWKTSDKIAKKLIPWVKEKPASDTYWANEILNGGYILFFRHAEREKWIDVKMYDALESDVHKNGKNGTRYAENEYFKKATCLNSRGLQQVKAMREIVEMINLPVGNVISSPICRARQTATGVFGRYDSLNRNLVHGGPYLENESKFKKFTKDYLKNLSIKEGTNTVITAHNGVIYKDVLNIKGEELSLEEGGFYIISNKGGKLELKHEFHEFREFAKEFFTRIL